MSNIQIANHLVHDLNDELATHLSITFLTNEAAEGWMDFEVSEEELLHVEDGYV